MKSTKHLIIVAVTLFGPVISIMAELYPIVEVDTGYFFGASDKGKWIKAEKAAKAVKYLDSYFGSAQVKIYWGTCQEFCEDLRVRWEAFSRG